MFQYPSFRSTFLVAGLILCASFVGAQGTPAVPNVNQKIKEAADPYKADPARASESLARFEALNTQSPHDPNVESWLGFLYIQTKSPKKAIEPLEHAAAARPDNLEVQTNLGNAYFEDKQFDKALACYSKVSAARPNLADPHYNIGVIYLQKEEYARAIVELKAAEALAPRNAFIKNNLGVAYERAKDDKNAAIKFREASDLKPDDRNFARNAGLAILRTRPPEDSRSSSYYDQARPYLERADDTDPAVALAIGGMLMSTDKPKALAYYDRAEVGLDDRRFTAKDRETYWYNVGVLRSQTKDSDGAIKAYERALEINPNDVDALKNLGMLHYLRAQGSPERKSEYSDAVTDFDKYTGLVPSSFEGWKNLGLAASRANNREKAVSAYREAISVYTKSAVSAEELVQVRVSLGDLLYDMGDKPAAGLQYRATLGVKKDNREALNGLGLIYLEDSKLPQAEAAFRSAIRSDPGYLAAYNNLAITLDKANRRKEAIAVLERALKIKADPILSDNLKRLKGP